MSSYDTWKLCSDRDDGPQDEPSEAEGRPDQQEEGFLALLATAKEFNQLHAGYSDRELQLCVEKGQGWFTPSMAKLVLSFRDAVQKAEGA